MVQTITGCGFRQLHSLRQRHHRRTWAPVGALLAALLISLPLAAMPRHSLKHAYQKQVERLEMQWRDAQVNNNVATMDSLLADDYIGIGANGTVQTKQETLDRQRNRTLVITSLDLSEVKVRVYGDTAVVTSRAELKGTNGGKDMSGTYHYTRVYIKKLNQWKIVSFEVTRKLPIEERPPYAVQ